MKNHILMGTSSLKKPMTVATVRIGNCWHSVGGTGWYDIIYTPDTRMYRADLWGNDNDGYQDYLYQPAYAVLASSPEFASEQAAHDYANAHWVDGI